MTLFIRRRALTATRRIAGRFRAATVVLGLCLSATLPLGGQAQAFDTQATAAYVVDLTTRTVLLEKNADMPLPLSLIHI